MLELMSVSLENWGYRAAHKRVENLPHRPQKAVPEKPHEMMVDVSSDGDAHSLNPLDALLGTTLQHANPLAVAPQPLNMFDSRASQPQIEPFNLNFITKQAKTNFVHVVMILILLMLVFLGLAYCMAFVCYDTSDYVDDAPLYSPSKDSKASGLSDEGGSPVGQSSWARAYLEAEGEQKDAFELLFRCNIISTEEFACSVISQEHIQECTWIAMHMLQHRPLEEWVALWQQAQQTFEDSVAECFEAKGGHIGLTARSLAQRLKISRTQYIPSSPGQTTSLPSSANLEFVSQDVDLRPLQS
jgi:hypothetical protein